MVCIPEIIINYRHSQEVNSFCKKNVLNAVCQWYSEVTNGNPTWLFVMSYESMHFYKNILKTILLDDTLAEKLIINYSMLNCLAMIVIFVANVIGIFNISNMVLEIDFQLTTPSDFTLMISNLPKDSKKDDLIELLTLPGIKLVDLNFTYKIENYLTFKKQLREVYKKIEYCKLMNLEAYSAGCICCRSVEKLHDLEETRKAILGSIKEQQDNFTQGEGKNVFSGTLFATFNTRADYEKFYEIFPHSIYFILYYKIKYYFQKLFCTSKYTLTQIRRQNILNTIRVIPAPEPVDIIWENLHFSSFQQLARAAWVYIVSLLLIACSFGAIIGLTYIQVPNKDEQFYVSTGYSILISIVITIINMLITYSLNKLSENEKRFSKSNLQLTRSIKLTFVI
jgi:hypothetical protein